MWRKPVFRSKATPNQVRTVWTVRLGRKLGPVPVLPLQEELLHG